MAATAAQPLGDAGFAAELRSAGLPLGNQLLQAPTNSGSLAGERTAAIAQRMPLHHLALGCSGRPPGGALDLP